MIRYGFVDEGLYGKGSSISGDDGRAASWTLGAGSALAKGKAALDYHLDSALSPVQDQGEVFQFQVQGLQE